MKNIHINMNKKLIRLTESEDDDGTSHRAANDAWNDRFGKGTDWYKSDELGTEDHDSIGQCMPAYQNISPKIEEWY